MWHPQGESFYIFFYMGARYKNVLEECLSGSGYVSPGGRNLVGHRTTLPVTAFLYFIRNHSFVLFCFLQSLRNIPRLQRSKKSFFSQLVTVPFSHMISLNIFMYLMVSLTNLATIQWCLHEYRFTMIFKPVHRASLPTY